MDSELVYKYSFFDVICFPVLIWDNCQRNPAQKVVMDITFAQPVVAVRVQRDRYFRVD